MPLSPTSAVGTEKSFLSLDQIFSDLEASFGKMGRILS